MALSEDFVTYVLDQLSGWGKVSVRRMFGGAGLYRDGKMFGLIAENVVFLKVDDTTRDDYEKAGSSPFMPFPDKGKTVISSYYEIPPPILENRQQLVQWAQKSLEIAGRAARAPRKARKARR